MKQTKDRIAQWLCQRVGAAKNCNECVHNAANHAEDAEPTHGKQNPILKEHGGCRDFHYRAPRLAA